MDDAIWIVQGSSGEYSDHREWLVCFYANEADAQALVEFLSKHARQAQIIRDDDDADWGAEHKYMKPFDPGYQSDYTGTNYCALQVQRGKRPA